MVGSRERSKWPALTEAVSFPAATTHQLELEFGVWGKAVNAKGPEASNGVLASPRERPRPDSKDGCFKERLSKREFDIECAVRDEGENVGEFAGVPSVARVDVRTPKWCECGRAGGCPK
jgi:hypothetical protein